MQERQFRRNYQINVETDVVDGKILPLRLDEASKYGPRTPKQKAAIIKNRRAKLEKWTAEGDEKTCKGMMRDWRNYDLYLFYYGEFINPYK